MYTTGLYKIYTKERGIVTTDIIGSNLRKLTWHRADGPANIWYNKDGTISYEAYCINGNDYTKEQYYRELLKLKVQSL